MRLKACATLAHLPHLIGDKMKKIFALVALMFTGAFAATSALYLHHERSTQATVEADCQNRELCLDKTNLAPLGRFNDGTLWHGVTQEKPNVNLTGTLTVTGATVLSNNLTLSLFSTGRIPYTTTAGLLTSGTGLTYNGSAFTVTGTEDVSGNFAINTNKFNVTAASGNTTIAGTLGVTGVTTATGGLTLGASFVDKTTSITSNTTLTSAHSVILADATGGAFTITLPTAVGNTGLTYKIIKNDLSTNAVSITTTLAQSIGNYTGSILVGNTSMGILEVISNGTNWNILRWDDQGTFTYTEATGVASTPTATATWTLSSAEIITITFAPVAGTGNTTGFTLTGLPAALRPFANQVCPVVLTDNGVMISGLASLTVSSSTITLSTTVASGTPVTYNTAGFTAAGTKQMGNGTSKATITYSLYP